MKSQIVTSSLGDEYAEHGGRRKLPYVFTEHLLSVPRSKERNENNQRYQQTVWIKVWRYGMMNKVWITKEIKDQWPKNEYQRIKTGGYNCNDWNE